MTRSDIAKLSDEEANIAIAIAQGFEIGFGEIINVEPDRDGEPIIVDHRPIPSYCSDLNAMHEVEKALNVNRAILFRFLLAENSGKHNTEFISFEAALCHATARQRAEAFLSVKQ